MRCFIDPRSGDRLVFFDLLKLRRRLGAQVGPFLYLALRRCKVEDSLEGIYFPPQFPFVLLKKLAAEY
jgi:hypothetical protein